MDRIKYPRTPHLPWSNPSKDDIVVDLSSMNQGLYIVTEKVDGENTTIYPDGTCHARSLNSKGHESRSWVKQLAAEIGPKLPSTWRICGENVYAKHSIFYDRLPSYFLVFSIWDEDICCSWDETLDTCELLGLTTVAPLMVTKDLTNLRNFVPAPNYGDTAEGYVARNIESFHFSEFEKNVVKYVRKNHVTSDEHWMYSQITPNRLAGEIDARGRGTISEN